MTQLGELLPKPCEWCKERHEKGTRIVARHKRYVRTRNNGWVAPTSQHNKSTHDNWGCRCEVCRTAHTQVRARNAKRERAEWSRLAQRSSG